jgi:hypothetical protein
VVEQGFVKPSNMRLLNVVTDPVEILHLLAGPLTLRRNRNGSAERTSRGHCHDPRFTTND